MSSERGSALLLAAATAAALGTLATVVLVLALTAYETAAWRIDGAQARLLAEATLAEVEAGMLAGTVLIPSGASPLEWTGTIPTPPPGFAPLLLSPQPSPSAPPAGGCGCRATLQRVIGPDGDLRTWALPDQPGTDAWLLEVAVEGWCGRGLSRQSARFAVIPGQLVRRLD